MNEQKKRIYKDKKSYEYFSKKLKRKVRVQKHGQHYTVNIRGKWNRVPIEYAKNDLITIQEAKDQLLWLKEKPESETMTKINELRGKNEWSDKLLDKIEKRIDFIDNELTPWLDEFEYLSNASWKGKESEWKQCWEHASLDEFKEKIAKASELEKSYYERNWSLYQPIKHRSDAWDVLYKYKLGGRKIVDSDLNTVKESIELISTTLKYDPGDVQSFGLHRSTYAKVPYGENEFLYFCNGNKSTKKTFDKKWNEFKNFTIEYEEDCKRHAEKGKFAILPKKIWGLGSMSDVPKPKGRKKDRETALWMGHNEIEPYTEFSDSGNVLLYNQSQTGALVTKKQNEKFGKRKGGFKRFKKSSNPLIVISPRKKEKNEYDYDPKKAKYPGDYVVKFIIDGKMKGKYPPEDLHELAKIMEYKKEKKRPSLTEPTIKRKGHPDPIIDWVAKKTLLAKNKEVYPLSIHWNKDYYILQAPSPQE